MCANLKWAVYADHKTHLRMLDKTQCLHFIACEQSEADFSTVRVWPSPNNELQHICVVGDSSQRITQLFAVLQQQTCSEPCTLNS